MRYTIYTWQETGFQHGWKQSESETVPDGAEVVAEFKPAEFDRKKVYAVDGEAK